MQTQTQNSGEREPVETEGPAPPVRLPYEAPVIESGLAFEKVLLASGCNSGIFDCDVPC